MTDRPLAGIVALVTGSSRAIGEAIACRLAATGTCAAVNVETTQGCDPQLPGTVHGIGATGYSTIVSI